MIRFALETENGIFCKGDGIVFHVKGEPEMRRGTLQQVFTSVHEGRGICFGIEEEPYHHTHCVTEIDFLGGWNKPSGKEQGDGR